MENPSNADEVQGCLRGSVLTQALSEMSQDELLQLGAEHSLRLAREQSKHTQLVARSNELMEKLTSMLRNGLPSRCLVVNLSNCMTDILNEQTRNNQLLQANNELLESLLRNTLQENELLSKNNDLLHRHTELIEKQNKFFDVIIRQACSHMVHAIDMRQMRASESEKQDEKHDESNPSKRQKRDDEKHDE